MTYLTWKALHIIGMVCWFAALFYLPRLYVYHAMAQDDGEEATMRRFCVMERKLYIMGHIGMGLTLVFGGLLLWAGGINRTFAAGRNRRSHVFYRFFNEVPSVALIGIVLLASLKPF